MGFELTTEYLATWIDEREDNDDGIPSQIAHRLRTLQKRVEELEAECFHLAANQCKYPVAGEHGDALCGEIERLRANQLSPELVRERLGTLMEVAEEVAAATNCPDCGNREHGVADGIHAAARALLNLDPGDTSPLEDSP